MHRVHLDLSVRGEISDAYSYSAEKVAKCSGFNLGNLVFRHALRTVIADLDKYQAVNYVDLKELIETDAVSDALVSCANWLGTRKEDESANKVRANLIEKIPGQVVSVGLGVQAPQDADRVALGPESQRLAQVLASKCALLSVRDQLTARTLGSLGIANVCVTGCPSNFINTRPNLGVTILERAQRYAQEGIGWRNCRTSASEFTGGHPRADKVLAKMLGIIAAAPAFYVAQSPALLPFLFQETDDIPAVYADCGQRLERSVSEIIKAKCLAFSSVDAWLDFSRTCNLAFGMRIHGTMVALQAGTPSILIGHDSRTSGLACEMGIPVISPENFLGLETGTPAALFEEIARQMPRYDQERQNLARKLHGFLDANGVPCKDEIKRLATL